MHNCEFGGAFYIASASAPDLEARLRAKAHAHGFALNRTGEPFSPIAPLSEAVFAAPRPTALVRMALENGMADPRAIWPAGASSTEYAARFDAFTLTVETPYWTCPGLDDPTPSAWTLTRVVEELVAALGRSIEAVAPWGETAIAANSGAEIAFALAEQMQMQAMQQQRLPMAAAAFGEAALSHADMLHYRIGAGLTLLRAPALLRRLAGALPAPDSAAAQHACSTHIASELQRLRAIASLDQTSIDSAARLQAATCVAALQAL